MLQQPRRALFAVAAAVALTAATACSATAPSADPAELTVIAANTVLGDLASILVADDGTVEVLGQRGADPHDLALSAVQVARLRDADLVVVNGLGLEANVQDVLDDAAAEGTRLEALAPRLDPLEIGERPDEHSDDDGDEHEHGDEDPHVWLDPVRMAEGARVLAGWLAEVDVVLADDEWERRGEALADEILAAHDTVVTTLAEVPDECRVLVTNHEAFSYFAHRYGFEVVGTIIPGTSTQAGASAGDLAELIELIEEHRVPAIFAETTQSTRLADALAEDLDRPIAVVELHSESLGPEGSGAETYIGMMTTNAELIADALSGCAP